MSAYLTRLGLAVDETLNVLLFDGSETQTISLHAAIARQNGARWGCILCRVLDVLVERDHCAKQLEPTAEQWPAALRAGALLAAIVAGLSCLGVVIGRAIF